MKKLTIKNIINEVLQTAIFDNDEVMNDFIEVLKNGAWGKPEHEKELTPRIFNEDGSIIEPTYETILSEYIVEITDITVEIEQAKVNDEALQYLADTDYLIIREVDSGVACPLEIKQLRAEARLRIVR